MLQKKSVYSLSADKNIYYRLIALWVLAEAMLGGIIHGFKIPVSGLVVGSCAIICICLIAWYVPAKGSIIKATIIVAIFKMILSPQSPPPAYIAVFFQGILGEVLFWNRKFYRISCMLLAIAGLLESGFQRVLMLTIVYGNDLWKVVNNFINGLTRQKTSTNYSLLIGSVYILLHFITGILVGWWASLLPGRVARWSIEQGNRFIFTKDVSVAIPSLSKKRRRLKKGLFIFWIFLIALYVQSYFNTGTPLLPSYISLKILLRSVIIVLSWIFIIGPLMKNLLHSWLKKKQNRSQREIQDVLALLPATQTLVVQSWKHSLGKKGINRLIATTKMILVNALNPIPLKQVYILTASVQTGKTTSLIKWSENRNNVFGILTPVVNGKKMFMHAAQRHLFFMEAKEEEVEILTVGRFVFSKKNFDKAIQIIREAIDKEGWLVIDEIGPMELRGEGFAGILKEVLAIRTEKILLVVREGLVEDVKEFFQLKDIIVIEDELVFD